MFSKHERILTIPLEQTRAGSIQFTRAQYRQTITASKVAEGNDLIDVRASAQNGRPFLYRILEGNPGWLTIDANSGKR